MSSAPSSPERVFTICVITGARSEYGLNRWVMEEIRERPGLRLQLVATASHLSQRHGLTYREIEADGLTLDAKVPAAVDGDTPLDLAKAVGGLTADLAATFDRLRPDLVLIIGDRYELLAVISACVLLTLPLAHLSGGEVTEGALDEQVRHAATKAAHLHCVANAVYARRVRQMGEEDWRICVTGEPGLDALVRLPRLDRAALCADLGIAADGPLGLVTQHAETLSPTRSQAALQALVQAMDWQYSARGVRYVITYPNADAGGDVIIRAWEDFIATHPGCVLIPSLGHKRYLSALAALDFMLGNSSSGLIEAPSLAMPAVNIGDRQTGRLRARSVIDVPPTAQAISDGIEAALAFDRTQPVDNPYGDSHASRRAVTFIEQALRTHSRDELLRKRFADLP